MNTIFLFSFLGALFQEVLHWYTVREKLDSAKYKKLISSMGYWVVTALMIGLTPPVIYALINGNSETPLAQILIMGAGAPLIVKKAVEIYLSKMDRVTLGAADTEPKAKLSDYFS